MLFHHRNQEEIKQERDQRLLNLIYETKASWGHAKETERAVYEANASTELHYRSRLQEQKYLYLYRIARKFKVHGELNQSVIDR